MKTLFDLNSIADGLLLVSLTAVAIVALGAGLNRLICGWAAAYRHTVWLATSICLLVTPVVSHWVPGILPRFAERTGTEPGIAAIANAPMSNSEPSRNEVGSESSASEPLSEDLVFTEGTKRNTPRSETNSTQIQTSSQSFVPLLVKGVVACWILGIAIYSLRIWRSKKQLVALFMHSKDVTDERLRSLVEKVADETGVKSTNVTLAVTQSEVGPLIWGVLPSRLLIPSSLSDLPLEAQEAAIRHEFAHVARGDEWVRQYLVVLRTLFWFHPLVRYCCDQVQLYAEKACDDHVLRSGHKPSEYSTLLLNLARRQYGMETSYVMSGMAQSQISSRIESILQANASRRPMALSSGLAIAFGMVVATSAAFALRPLDSQTEEGGATQQSALKSNGVQRLMVGARDWPQWGGSSARNNVTTGQKIPLAWDMKTGKNVRWSMPLGSEAYGGVVVANGKVFAGTNNGAGYLKRFPNDKDLSVLLCFNEADGKFLWQHSNEKLPAGRVNDWPNQGICSAPLVDGDRLWYVTNRGEVVCLDTEGLRDGENDGPYKQEDLADQKNGADVIWVFDMMKQLGVFQHNMANCSITCAGDMLFVNTSQGVDEGHVNLPAEAAPSFICLSRETGGVLWTDNSPSGNILHGQWSSPAYAILGDVPQVIFGSGDGYLYGFLAQGENGNSKLLWKFDCNPKDSRYALGGTATRNHIIATPVIYDGLVYVAVGEDPEHGEGPGHLWCIDPTKRGDVSPTLVFNSNSTAGPIEHKRIQALVAKEGDFEKPNPNSAAVWHYVGNSPETFEQTMHRSVSTVAIKNNLLFVPDFSGVFHCVDAKTGKVYWTHDLFAACWASPLIVDDRVYISDEDGKVTVFKLSKDKVLLAETRLNAAIYTTPVVANDTLFVAARNRLWALQEGANSKPNDVK